MNYTLNELERIHYANGDIELAKVFANADDNIRHLNFDIKQDRDYLKGKVEKLEQKLAECDC